MGLHIPPAVATVKGDVGLGNVDNTSDAGKPVSTAQATAIAAKEPTIAAGNASQYWRGDKTWQVSYNTDPVAVTNMWIPLSGRPNSITTSSGPFAKDNWRLVPCYFNVAVSFKALTVETTQAASGGTAVLNFALYSVGSDGRPNALVTDLSAATIDLTATAGVLQNSFSSTAFPAGRFFIGCAWSGTATVAPRISTIANSLNSIVDSAPGFTDASGYLAAASWSPPPSTLTVSTAASPGPVIFGQMA